ncbi:hypothetical protein [Aquimarina sp. MMG016]|uniref:hypothetical protein n=1 Tax=Aquimarina sp. MMG016 TaxID=2822690 RepID=UPI001B39F293|nr:hypothetical protein [Aquimarina sp. MMG016]MBQ4822020.1 hypothetical protein [Aquimarina sp. MMG016]
MRSLLFIGILLICFSCKKENTSIAQEENSIIPLDSLSKEKIDFKLLKLSSQSQKDLESFEDFQNFNNLIISLHNYNPYYIKKYADSIDVLIQIVDENLSEDFNVNTINSRLTVLSTESGLLKKLAQKKHPSTEKLLEANKRLLKAYNSLVIQLNELSLAIPENIEKELLRDRDSLREPINDTKERIQE